MLSRRSFVTRKPLGTGSDPDGPGVTSSALLDGPALFWVITSLPPAGPVAITSKAALVVATPSGRGWIALALTTFSICHRDDAFP